MRPTLRFFGQYATPILARHGAALPASPERYARASRRLAWAKRFGGAWSLVAAAMIASTGGALADTNTSLPFADDFEGYTNGTSLDTGTNGWYGTSANIIVQTNTVRTGTKAAMLPLDCTLSNRFTSIPPTNVWIQMDVRPNLYDATNYPVVDTNTTWLFFVNSTGNFVVHNGSTTNADNSTNWMELKTNILGGAITPVASNTWVRINIYENFARTNWNLTADGIPLATNIGFVNTNLTNFAGFDVYNGDMTSYLDNVYVTVMNTNQYTITVLPPTLSAVAFAGQTPPVQTIQVYNVYSTSINFQVTSDQPWILPTNGTVPATNVQNVILTYSNTVTWPAGAISNALVTVVGNGVVNTQTVAVTMTIMGMQVDPPSMTNNVMVGTTNLPRDFYVRNMGAGSFDYTATIPTNTCDWLSFAGLTSTNGTVSAGSSNKLTLTYSNTAWWTPGTVTNTTVTVFSAVGGGATQPVVVYVTNSMVLQIVTNQLTNTVIQGQTLITNFLLWSTNSGVATYEVANGHPDWLMLSPPSGNVTGTTEVVTNTITYTNTAALTVGAHYDTITISAPGCSNVIIDVTLNVEAPPMLNVSPALISKTVMAGQNLSTQALWIWNGSTNHDFYFKVTTNQGNGGPITNWLFVQVTTNYLPPSQTNNATIQYEVSTLPPAGDGPSNYIGAITVTATNDIGSPASGSPVTIPVTVQVNPKPRLAVSLNNLSQTAVQGHDAVSQWFEVWNSNGFFTLGYTITKNTNATWLVPSPISGTSTGQHARIEVQYSTANLPAGTNSAVITVVGRALVDGVDKDSALSATQQITVTLSVTSFATLATDAQPINIPARKGVTPSPTVWNVWSGGNPPNAMYFTVSPSVDWLRVTPSSGTSTGIMNKVPVSIQAHTANMKPGISNCTVRIDAVDANSGRTALGSPQTFTVTVNLSDFKGFNFFGGDSGASDLVVYREANGDWAIGNLLSGRATNVIFGGAGYQAMPGDYLGDGITDLGVYRQESGSWYAWQVAADSVQVVEWQQWIWTGYVGWQEWGWEGYVGVPGDYDGDGLIDPGMYDEQSGLWVLLWSGTGYQPISGYFGGKGYEALQSGDYDGDGETDPGVYNRSSGLWGLLFSSTSYDLVTGTFGGIGFVPVPADYDGDYITDPAVYETSTGRWYILWSSQDSMSIYQFGGVAMSATLVPAPGNYDGVGGADLALYDTTTGKWRIITTDGAYLAWDYPLGGFGYQPVLP